MFKTNKELSVYTQMESEGDDGSDPQNFLMGCCHVPMVSKYLFFESFSMWVSKKKNSPLRKTVSANSNPCLILNPLQSFIIDHILDVTIYTSSGALEGKTALPQKKEFAPAKCARLCHLTHIIQVLCLFPGGHIKLLWISQLGYLHHMRCPTRKNDWTNNVCCIYFYRHSFLYT